MVKSRQKKRVMMWTVVIGLALFILMLSYIRVNSSGEPAGGGQSETIVLRLWYPWANEENALRKPFLEAVEEFNGENAGIQIQAEGIEAELYRTKLPTAVATNDTPDIYFCYGDAYLRNIAASGKILKLNGYLEKDVEVQAVPEALEGMKYEDGIYGLGFREAYGVFLVNREMFQTYGLTVPNNQEELAEVCRTFLEKGITPLACSSDDGWGYFSYLQAICLGMAGKESCRQIMAGDGKEGGENFEKGLECFQQLRDMGAFGEETQKKTTQEIESEFYLSRIPMYYAPSEFISNIILENCPLYHKIEAAAFPVSNGYQTVLGGISEAFVVNRTAEYPEEAVFALSRLVMTFSEKLYQAGAGLPAWKAEGILPPREEVWGKARDICLSAKEKMGRWDTCLDVKRFTYVNEKLQGFIEGNMSAGELMQKLIQD